MFNKKKPPPIKSLLAHGCQLTGNFSFADGLRLDGEMNGDLLGQPDKPSILVISETAHVTGQVQADHVIINGQVDGPVLARNLLELQPKARVTGDVTYRILEMHQGALVAGKLFPLVASPQVEEKPTLKLAANNQ